MLYHSLKSLSIFLWTTLSPTPRHSSNFIPSESLLGLTSPRSIVHYIIWIPWPTKPTSVCTSSTSSSSVQHSHALCSLRPFPVPPKRKNLQQRLVFSSYNWAVVGTELGSFLPCKAFLWNVFPFIQVLTWLISSKTLVLSQSPTFYYLSGQLYTFLASGTFIFLLFTFFFSFTLNTGLVSPMPGIGERNEKQVGECLPEWESCVHVQAQCITEHIRISK